MKPLLHIALVSMALLLSSEAALAVTIRGAASCEKWVDDREQEKSGKRMMTRDVWLVGYLSGLASGTQKEFWGKPGVDALDNDSALLWMDNYCRANPLKDADDGAVRLFLERTRGK